MTNSHDAAPVFCVDYICANCGFDWQEGYRRGDEVNGGYPGPFVQVRDCKGSRVYDCGCHTIRCSNCDSNHVLIKERRPI